MQIVRSEPPQPISRRDHGLLESEEAVGLCPPALRGGGAEAEGRVVFGAGGFAAASAERAGVAAEEPGGFDLGLVHRRRAFGVGGDVQRVGRAVDLAHEAGLAAPNGRIVSWRPPAAQ